MCLPPDCLQDSLAITKSRFLTALLPTLTLIACTLFLPIVVDATCLDFNPWYDMIEVQPNPNLNVSRMTIEAWVRLTQDLNLASGYAILDKNLPSEVNPDPSDSNYLLFIEGTNDYLGKPSQYAHSVGWSVGNGTSFARVYSQTKTPGLEGEWHHISGTYDGSVLRLYVDGELEGSVAVQMQPVNNDGLLTLGWSPVGYLLSWYGRLDEVRIWNFSRSQSEIKQTMSVRMTGTEAGLVAYWNFDEGSGQVAHDLAGSDNHGQLGSTPNPDDQDPNWDAMTAPCDRPLKIVTTSPLPAAKLGEAYTLTFQAEGGFSHYRWDFVSGSLPAGLSLSEGGTLSGTPLEHGDFNFSVRVTDQGNPPASNSAAFDLHVAVPELVIATTSLPGGVEGAPYNQALQAQGGIPPYRWTVSSGNLPDGLVLNATAGTISGTPTNAAIRTSFFSILAQDSQSPSASDEEALSITIAAAIELAITSGETLPDGKMGDEYDFGFTAQGGKLPYAWEIASGALPAGLNLSGNGWLSGTPQEYGDFVFVVRVRDSQQPAQTNSQQCMLYVSPDDLVIETTSLPSGGEDIVYNEVLRATGGVSPYLWELSSGSLPPGLSLDASSGIISGTPPNAGIGSWSFTIAVSDSQSPAAVDDQSFSITVAAAAPLRVTSSALLPDGKVGEDYSYVLTATGGKLPYRWGVVSGALPGGLSLSSDGDLTGTPSSYGIFSFAIRVADSQQTPATDSQDFSVSILPANLRISTPSLPDATEGAPYNQALIATGGIPPCLWEVISGSLPQGLTLSANGTIGGTPTNAAIGVSSFTTRVTDSQSQPDEDARVFSITVLPARSLSITTGSRLPSGRVGEEYNFSLAAVGGKLPYNWTLESGALPEGLSLSANGVISGTPTQYGETQFTVRVSDSQQPPETQTALFTIAVTAANLRITMLALSNGTEDVLYGQMLQATGGVTPLRWSVLRGALPDGLILNSQTGMVAGTPTNAGIGNWSFTIAVSDSQVPAAQDTREFSIGIVPAAPVAILTGTPLPDGKVGEQYSVGFSATGGKLPYVWRIVSGNLPTGLSLASSGMLSGTPAQYGDFSFTAEVADGQETPWTAARQFSLHIRPGDLVILTSALPDGREGIVYSQKLEASGGVVPYLWEIVSGSLPDGLSLNRVQGVISGTPTNVAIGTATFTIRVSDNQSPAATSERVFSITVLSSSQLGITSASPLPDGKAGQLYSHSLVASGGKLPYTWSLDSGSLPPGLDLSRDGKLSGTPSEHGDFTFTVSVKDSQAPPASATKLFALHIAPSDLRITTASLPQGLEGARYSQKLEAAGGVGPYSWQLVEWVLPEGLSLNPSSGTISGTPTNPAIGTSGFTLRVMDSQSPAQEDERAFSITVAPAQELAITSTSPTPDGKVGAAYQFTFSARGGKLPYSWSIMSGSLPSGLTVSHDGALTGTPVQYGDFTFAIQVADSQAPADTANMSFAIHVSPEDLGVITLFLPDGKESMSYSPTLQAKGGVLPYAWRVVSGAFPDGMKLDAATGVITGTPTNAAIGKSSFTVRVSDSQSPADQDEQTFTITVSPKADLQIVSTSPLPDGKVGEPFACTLTASGGKRPYAWGIVSGVLPSGLMMNTSGGLTGTPTQQGNFTFTIRVLDSQEVRDSAERQFLLRIAPREIEIEVAPTELTFSTRRGGADPAALALTVRATGTQRITWQALENCGWLSLNPTTDTNAGEEDVVTVSVAKSGLDIGTYDTFIDVVPIEMPEKHKIVRVVLHVNPIKVPEEYSTIQKAIDAAASLDMVLVAPGVYYERIATKPDIQLAGSGAERTTIDAQQQGTAVALIGDRSSVEGFTIRNGIGDFYGNGSRVGGGVYCGALSTKISGCRIVSNTAIQGWGGAVFVKTGCSVVIVDSHISGNSAESGGAIFCHERSRAVVQTSILRENSAQWFGGGLCNIDLSSSSLLGCEFSRNSAGYSGGAVAMKDRSELSVVNCTFADNLADEAGAIFSEYLSSVFLTNSLFWNDGSDLVLLGKSDVQFCNIRDGSFAGANHNFSIEPHFVNASEGDYHLLPNSQCLDAGDNNADDLPATDIDGELRVLLSYIRLAPDIGADELDSETVFAVVDSPVTVGGDGSATVHYTLWNGRATPSSIVAEYSTDSGAGWHFATRAMTSEGTDSLATSAVGTPHTFVWDSVADVGAWKEDGVQVRIKPLAAKAHRPATTEAFSLDNSAADSDDDRLPDSWEWQIVDANRSDSITAVSHVLPGDDFDGDGRPNAFEYLTGTSPTHPASFFDVEFALQPDGGLALRCPSVLGKVYAVYYCEGLGTPWLLLGEAQLGTADTLAFTDDAAITSRRMRFYKVTVY